MEPVVIMMLAVAVIVVTAVLFVVWTALQVILAVMRGVTGLFRGSQRAPSKTGLASSAMCPRARCREANPVAARFCRRCGGRMPGVQPVQVRRMEEDVSPAWRWT